MTKQTALDAPSWWASLKHGGMLIAPERLVEFFDCDFPELPRHVADRLRRDLLRVRDGDKAHVTVLLDTVLEDVIGLEKGQWTKGSDVDTGWSQKAITGEIIKPRRIWQGEEGGILPVFVADGQVSGQRYSEEGRLGIGRGRRLVSRVVEWLRRSGEKIALLTNGHQWRLIHAGSDYDAWCEWDCDLWFEEGRPGPQIEALRVLLRKPSLQPLQPDGQAPIIGAILASRRGQAELSAALGERVRLAVELLIRQSSEALAEIDGPGRGHVSRRDIYIAATRLVMRCVVILFAEARDLLPRDNAIYHDCYGVQGLREQLARIAGGRNERLRHFHSAWPRLVSLFRLIYFGSPHEAMPVPKYGGGLFTPGDINSKDPVLRALSAFESSKNSPTDAAIHEILDYLCISRVKVRQGRSATWVPTPVDFSDLSSEYIGILYEGLLDFELHRVPDDDAIVFLRLGDEPALPLSRLEREMAPKRLADLIGKLKKGEKKGPPSEEEEQTGAEDEENSIQDDISDESDSEEGTETDEQEEAIEEEEVATEGEPRDFSRELRERAEIWAEKAVKEAKIVPYPKCDADPVVRERWNEDVRKKAKSLYRLILPGEWYLVRWGGTRKGAGTFYTRPQLAVPTVRRTLQPLCYEAAEKTTDPATGLTTVTKWVPRLPEEILALKVCDAAVGSASFQVASLRYITDSLVESLYFHGRILPAPDGAICKLADGLPQDHPSQETLPVPMDHPEFDDRLRARLKRHVVERCIYGVDIDPLAVELARMALWIETMDRQLPFGFLDHKLRCGNSLVGCWFDRFRDYPVMAFERDDAGDKSHTRFVHHSCEYTVQRGRKKGELARSGDVWTRKWKAVKEDVIQREMPEVITGQEVLPFIAVAENAQRLHDEALTVFQELHDIPIHDVESRERLYREKIADNPALGSLREAFDTWCATWFWPGDKLDLIPTPHNFLSPPEETRKVVTRVREEQRFFHWEIEFPDVFIGPNSGFDAMLGNPPWEIQKPISKEFFSNVDPLYRTYGKQEALKQQTEYFTRSAETETDWLNYCARFKSFSTWNKYASVPYGDNGGGGCGFSFSRSKSENEALHKMWRKRREARVGYADPEHPFQHQGSADINTYKMFVEMSRVLLRDRGVLGLLVPSGIYTDKGSTDLRNLLLERSQWEWLFGIENRQKIFDIDSRFKFNPIIVRKGGETSAIRASFMHRSLEDWEEAERHVLPYPRSRVQQFSPRSSAILEIGSQRDLEVLEKIYANSVLLGDDGPDGWGIRYAREFDMTNDSKLFPPRPWWEERGYRPNEYGLWIGPDGDVALPLYEGRMIGQFDFSQKGWVSGKGRGAVWRDIPFDGKTIEPQYCMKFDDYISAQNRDGNPKSVRGAKIGFMDVSSATNERTMIASLVYDCPCGNSTPVLKAKTSRLQHGLVSILNTFVYDYLARCRCGGLHLNYFVIEETALPRVLPEDSALAVLEEKCLQLNGTSPLFAGEWMACVSRRQLPWRGLWCISPHERLRIRCIVDSVVAHLFQLGVSDLSRILFDCDHPRDPLRSDPFCISLDGKGFWRVDKEKDPELRHTVLTQVAFHELKRLGLDAFLALNDGEGWMIPEKLRLADYGLGHDDRAKEAQPVASRLGPRFLPWQLEQTPAESWEECERHAERLKEILGPVQDSPPACAEPPDTDLFGNIIVPRNRSRSDRIKPAPEGGT